MLHAIDMLPVVRALTLRLFILLVFVTLFSYASTTQATTEQKKDNYVVSLQKRTYTPTAGIDTQTVQRLNNIIIQEKQTPHILLQLKRTPTRSERMALQARGVKLLAYVGGNAWHASLTDSTPLSFIESITRTKYPVLNIIRWIGQLEPEDKIDPVLREAGPGSWATNADGTIKVSVDFYTDVPRERASETLKRHGAVIESERTRRVSFYVVIEPGVMEALAAEDGVKSIDLYPPQRIESNDGSRAWTNTDAVHAENAVSDAVINIEGNGVILGMWDGNEADDAHHDLTGRVVYGEVPRTGDSSEHSTHVACTLAGSGTITPARRGHAPEAPTIVSFDFLHDIAAETEQGIQDHELVSINNSWNWPVGWRGGWGTPWDFRNDFHLFGAYVAEASDFDDLVRSERVVIVQAAGNDRDDPEDGSDTPAEPADADQGIGNGGFDTIAPPATGKNIISVGPLMTPITPCMREATGGPPTTDVLSPTLSLLAWP